MNTSVNELAETLRTCPSEERAHVVFQIDQRGHEVWGAIVARFLEIDEFERRSVIMPITTRLNDPAPAAREAAALGLLNIGHFCLPFLEEMSALQILEHEPLVEKIALELQQLERSIVDVDHSLMGKRDSFGSVSPSLDTLLQACIPVVPAEIGTLSAQASDRHTMALCEINVDAWVAARKEILKWGGAATDFLTGEVEDPDPQIRRVVLLLLGILQDTKSEPFLVNALGDSDVFVRGEAIRALGRLKGSARF